MGTKTKPFGDNEFQRVLENKGYKPMDVCRRIVMAKQIPSDYGDLIQPPTCYDCGKIARFNMMESNGNSWVYCGICEVG